MKKRLKRSLKNRSKRSLKIVEKPIDRPVPCQAGEEKTEDIVLPNGVRRVTTTNGCQTHQAFYEKVKVKSGWSWKSFGVGVGVGFVGGYATATLTHHCPTATVPSAPPAVQPIKNQPPGHLPIRPSSTSAMNVPTAY